MSLLDILLIEALKKQKQAAEIAGGGLINKLETVP